MDLAELDTAISDIEARLERLRALYEQYFLGFEKIEPLVARKEVDRRIWALRRTRINNTARRFKLQTVVQRYNTYQQYWARICREIENGTYKRHLARVQRQMDEGALKTNAARRRLGRNKGEEERPEQSVSARDTAEQDMAELLASDVDPAEELRRAVAAAATSVETGHSSRPEQPSSGGASSEVPASAPNKASPSVPASAQRTSVPASAGGSRSSSPAERRPSRKPLGSLDLDLDGVPKGPPAAAGPARGRDALPPRPAPAAPPPGADKRPGLPPPKRAPAKPALGAPPVRKPAPSPAGRPSPPAPRPAAKKPAAAPPKPAAAAGSALSDAKLKELHSRLVQARSKTNEKAKTSLEGLAKSVRAAESKLKARHGNRRIDFDIVIKDGKAVVKPKVR